MNFFSLTAFNSRCIAIFLREREWERTRRRKENPNRIIYHGWGNISKTCWNNFVGIYMLKKLFEFVDGAWCKFFSSTTTRINWFFKEKTNKIQGIYLVEMKKKRSERAQLELTVENWFMIYDHRQDVVHLVLKFLIIAIHTPCW